MLIVSNVKHEGVFNLDKICHLQVKELMSADNEVMYSLFISGEPALPHFLGEWDTRDQAEAALDKIVRGNHEGLREVLL